MYFSIFSEFINFMCFEIQHAYAFFYTLLPVHHCNKVGTESEPFSHRAIITLHGHVRSKELPVYGTKMIGVRNGSLELHGTSHLMLETIPLCFQHANYKFKHF